MKFYILLVPSFRLLVTISILFSFSSFAEIRYVSKTGSSIPPYTSWATAADSIMKAINLSNSGDTIYVGNGVYKEIIEVKRGLALIGSGIDSCIIDTRTLATTGFFAVTLRDSCLIRNFRIKASNYNPSNGQWLGVAIYHYDYGVPDYPSLVENVLVENALTGLASGSANTIFNYNFVQNCNRGIDFAGISINYFPKSIGNIITVKGDCIYLSFGTTPYIANNICIGNRAYWGGYSGKNELYNNLFIVQDGIYSSDTTEIVNNVITGRPASAILAPRYGSVRNNVVINAQRVFYNAISPDKVIKYNNIWRCGIVPPLDSTNIFEDPMFVQDTSDFHLQMYSKLIDAGDPSILDKDGTRSDIGLFGGPLGESYTYQDLAPRAPVNLYCVYDTNNIFIKWNRNTESDFSGYNIYRDTTADFTIDSTKLISTQKDTFFIQNTPHNVNALYYKLTATDNQGNESQPSEQISVILSNINNSEPVTVYDYKLYQNYPNPFNPSTKISYILKERGYVKLMIYDLQGELVRVLVNETKERGYYEKEFNADGLSSGIYIYRIDIISSSKGVPVFTDVRKMIYLK